MKTIIRQGTFHHARNHFSLEQLEARELMASDLVSVTSLLDSATNEVQTASTSATRTTSSRLTQNTGTVAVATRTIDGTGNNLANTELGSTNEQLLRVAAAEYADGILSMAGATAPTLGGTHATFWLLTLGSRLPAVSLSNRRLFLPWPNSANCILTSTMLW